MEKGVLKSYATHFYMDCSDVEEAKEKNTPLPFIRYPETENWGNHNSFVTSEEIALENSMVVLEGKMQPHPPLLSNHSSHSTALVKTGEANSGEEDSVMELDIKGSPKTDSTKKIMPDRPEPVKEPEVPNAEESLEQLKKIAEKLKTAIETWLKTQPDSVTAKGSSPADPKTHDYRMIMLGAMFLQAEQTRTNFTSLFPKAANQEEIEQRVRVALEEIYKPTKKTVPA
jgi:hypothetical protein